MKNEKQKNTNEKKLSRKTIISLVVVVLFFAAVSVAMIPLIRLLSSEHGQEIIIEKMQSFGIFAPLLFVLLQVLQVVVAVIPGGGSATKCELTIITPSLLAISNIFKK